MSKSTYKLQRGISLIEVLIAVVILSFGMLALASLQAQLFRAGAESKARAAAVAFAQGQIESLRTFRSLTAGTDPYQGIATAKFGGAGDPSYNVAGVVYYGCVQVRRYRYNGATFTGPAAALPDFSVTNAGVVSCGAVADPNAGTPVSTTIPEFKEITASVGWFDQSGTLKTVQLTDTIAAISPDDALQLAKTPPEATQGPMFYVKKSAVGASAGMVPIAMGDNRTSASTNPTPMQYVDSLSSVTSFDVLAFSSTSNPEALNINRRLSVSAVSCVCQNNGKVSSSTEPAYEPTVWNGKFLSYMPASLKPNGLPIGSYEGSNSDQGINTICTICCRDHYDSDKKGTGVDPNLRVDPYRSLAGDGSHQHYGFKKQGKGYILGTLLPVGADTSNEYVEACRVIRVGGRLQVAVDGRQNTMTVTALNTAQTGFEQSTFIDRYSAFVKQYSAYAIANKPNNYPVAPTKLPGPDTTITSAYADILEPPALKYADSAASRKLLSFGLYIDYMSPDTLQAYACALAKNNTGSCKGFGTRDPLEYVPFYAVNVASLGFWSSAPNESIVKVNGAVYNNKGQLATQGGITVWGSGASDTAVPGTENINISNSGLTATVPIDDDDDDTTSFVTDAMSFLKTTGVSNQTPKHLTVKVAGTSTITLTKGDVTSPLGTQCNHSAKTSSFDCVVGAGDTTTYLRIANFTTSSKVKGQTVTTDRKVCLPNDNRILNPTVANDATVNEFVEMTIQAMNTTDHTLVIEIQDAATPCDQGTVTLTPAN